MFRKWLTKLEPVSIAQTPEEREAVYRFRYQVYFKEYGRQLGSPDHARQWVTDEDDEKEFSTILYTGTTEEITGTVRLRHWDPGCVPRYEIDEVSMDLFPDLAQRHTGEIGRLMIRRTMRGKLLLAAIMQRAYELFCGDYQTDLVFLYCSPGLVHHYRKLGCRTFGGRIVHAPDGIMVPLVNIVSDLDYHRRVGSLVTPLIRRYFGPGKRPPLDLAPYRHILESEEAPIELDAEKIWDEMQQAVTNQEADSGSFLDSLPEDLLQHLGRQGFVLRVTAETLMTRAGFGEQEMYLVLDGAFEVTFGGNRLAVMGRGDLFGELAFFLPGRRRTADVRALTDGTLLVLRARTVQKLIKSDAETAARLLLQIGAVMAERLAVASAKVSGAPAADDESG
ncbi:MAG: cyclic nucleotide-binding domain-containing protein [bacterium]|nr:cyclic nucleotide-binding domain-containing protein [bacterium]